MLFNRLILLLLILFMPFISVSQAIERIEIKPKTHKIEYLIQEEKEYFIDSVAKLEQKEWQIADSALRFGFLSRNYWIRLTIDNNINATTQRYLESSNPLIDKLEVYIDSPTGFIEYKAGDTLNANVRPTQTRVFLFPLPQQQTKTIIYLKYYAGAASTLPLALVTTSEALTNAATDAYSFGIITALLLLAAISAAVAFLLINNRVFLYFSAYSGVCFLLLTVIEGYAGLSLWPSVPWLQNLLSPTLAVLALWLFTLFYSETLSFTQHLSTGLNSTLKVFTRFQLICCALLLFTPLNIAALTTVSIAFITVSLLGFAIYQMLRKHQKIDWLYLGSGLSFFAAISSKILYLSGLCPLPEVTAITRLLFALHISLIAIALIKEHIDAYSQSLKAQHNKLLAFEEAAKETENDLEQQHQEQINLEALVDERTFELNVTLRELQETNRRLEEQATNDALTGAKNRKFYDQRLQAEYRLSRRQRTPVSLLMLDIDYFKKVNDTYGHLVGDKVLVSFVEKSTQALGRPNDYVCRYGGEEFAILLSNTDHVGALKVAELIRSRVEQNKLLCDGVQIAVTVSVGVSTLIIEDETPQDELFKLADKALYQAKQNGRNQVYSITQEPKE